MYHILRSALSASLPLPCAACGQLVLQSSAPLCAACWAGIYLIGHPKPVSLSFSQWGWSWLPFELSVVRQSMAALKFKGRADLGLLLGAAMAKNLERPEVDLLAPIPLTMQRRYARGYNQAERIAQGLGRVWDLPVAEDLLSRPSTWNTLLVPKQSSLSRAKRSRIYGAYDVAEPERWRGLRIALVDDTLTTGSTLNAAAEVCIKKARVAAIIPLTLAYASRRAT